MSEVLVDMRSITKRFPGTLANDRVNFQLARGEIHALLGENGAGKSTLMSVLSGFYRPDEGEIIIRGQKTTLRSPKEALERGVGMVHQHFRLVEPFTVAENIVMGTPAAGRLFFHRKKSAESVLHYANRFGLEVDPNARIWQLSVGEKQRVEILKLLHRGADVLILDEPTAVLTPQEVKELFQNLRKMAAEGKAIILITHKLQEVMDVADRITVLRKGRNVGTVEKREVDERELTRMMVERDVLFSTTQHSLIEGETVLALESLEVMGDRGIPAIKNLSLQIHRGEILGIAGIAGNGQRELAEAVTGLRSVSSGRILLENRDLTNGNPKRFIEAGVSYIPEDRLGTGLVPNLDLYDNVILKEYRKPPIGRGLFLNRKEIRKRAEQLVSEFKIQVSDLEYPVRLLSGGNLQKVLLAREILSRPKLVVAAYPVRGLDIGATEAVYRLLLGLRNEGAAILLISEDLDELLTLSDRIAVLFRGEIMGVVPASEAEIEDLGLMMTGGRKGGAGYEH